VGDNLRDQAGLGYGTLEAQCQLGAVGDTAADVAACVVAEYECRAEVLFERQVPRAKELMALAGVPQVDIDRFACLAHHPGTGADLDDPKGRGKAVQKCQDAVTKAAVKLATTELKGQGKCLDKLYKCVQTKPGDAGCLAKADGACDKEQAKIAKARTKLDSTIDRKCAPLDFGGVVTPSFGLNLDTLDVGGGPPGTLLAYEDAVRLQTQCLGEEMLGVTMPRIVQMLGLQNPPVSLPSAGCGP
jgi:hypothetical protein